MDSSVRQKIIQLTKNPMMVEFNGQRIVERLTEKDLIKLEKIMKKHTALNITSFLRIMKNILRPNQEEDFYITYGLFRLFQQTCIIAKHNELTFKDISSMVTDKMPSFNQDMVFSQKMYPTSFQIPDNIKKKIFAPEVVGKVIEERQRLQEQPYLSDKFIHLNKRVGQSFYSPKNKMFITIDNPSSEIFLLDSHFELKQKVKSELELSKRDSIILWITWSEEQQRLAALLGNYSLSLWANEDNFRYEVNVPLPLHLSNSPYIRIGYMQTSKIWYALDSRPSIYILSNENYEPNYVFSHFKMVNENNEKVMILQIKYRKLLCIALEKNIFLVSLEKRQLVTQLRNFTTTITSIAFSETYQALFVSNFQNRFYSYELTDHLDLTQKGKFQGHKDHVNMLGVLQHRPVVFSIDEKSIIKLWDIRDFMCYQTFNFLKNVNFRDIIHLPEAVCFIGSRHFCYRWQKFRTFKQTEKVIYINQFEKNILIVTSKQVRIYSHSSGVLLKVLKGIFGNAHIIRAYLIQFKKVLLLMNEEGLLKTYGTKDFMLINTFQFLPKPLYIYYDRQTELISFACMGELKICLMKDMVELPQKRTVFNDEEIMKFCQISSAHDLVMIQYEDNLILFFYSYERAKLLGHLRLEDFVTAKLMPHRNVLLILCKDKLLLMTYRKNLNSLAFMLKGIVNLWQAKDVQNNNISFYFKPFNTIISAGMEVFNSKIVIVSNDACFHCHISLNLQLLQSFQIKINKQYYNPYRIANQNHSEAFDSKRTSILIEQKINVVKDKQYFKHKGNKIFVMMGKINLFYCVADEQSVSFYNVDSFCLGIIDFKQTLPQFWELHNYSQEDFKELQFVLQFIQRQKHKEDEVYQLTASSLIPQGDIITMSMLHSRQSQPRAYRSTSLREKKMTLQKERDQRQKEQNYQQVRRMDELTKLKHLNNHSNENYVSESLAFLNVNRNKLILTKGIQDIELPQIRALQYKLNVAINRDQKKSIISRYSAGQDFMSPIRKVQEEITKNMAHSTAQLKPILQTQRKQSYKEQLKRLDLNLRKSKFKRPSRSGSLPALKFV